MDALPPEPRESQAGVRIDQILGGSVRALRISARRFGGRRWSARRTSARSVSERSVSLCSAAVPLTSLLVDCLLPGSSLSGLRIPLSDNTLSRHLSRGSRRLYVTPVPHSAIGKHRRRSIPALLAEIFGQLLLFAWRCSRVESAPTHRKHCLRHETLTVPTSVRPSPHPS